MSCHAFLPYSALVWWAGCVCGTSEKTLNFCLQGATACGSMQSVANEDIAYFLCKRTCMDRPGQRRLQPAIKSYYICILYTLNCWMNCRFLVCWWCCWSRKMESRSHDMAPSGHHVPIYDCVYLCEDNNQWQASFCKWSSDCSACMKGRVLLLASDTW